MRFEKRTAATRSPNPSSVPRPGVPKETGYSNVNRPCGSRYVAKPGFCGAAPAMAVTISATPIDAEQRHGAWSIGDHRSTVALEPCPLDSFHSCFVGGSSVDCGAELTLAFGLQPPSRPP